MRAVLDTNVVASALLWGGTPERLIELAGEGRLDLVTSEGLVAELAGILERPKFAERLRQKNIAPGDIVARYQEIAEIIVAAPITETALRDPADAAVLACARAASADLIVSGDKDLLVLKMHHGVSIVNAAEALRIIGKPKIKAQHDGRAAAARCSTFSRPEQSWARRLPAIAAAT